MERTRGIIGQVMPDEVNGGPNMADRYLLLVRPDGEARMVHTEGVAYLVTEDKPWCWTDFSDAAKKWSLEELLALEGCEERDLAGWVRTFGARLESNFAQIVRWYQS